MAGSPVGKEGKPLKVRLPLVNGAILLAGDEVHVEGIFGGAPRGIAFRNGFLRLIDQKVLAFAQHDMRHLARWGYEFEYDPSAACPQWIAFLHETFEGAKDAEQRIACLQEYAGACVLGIATNYHRALVALGQGANGKGVTLSVFSGLMPPGTVESIPPQTWEASTASRAWPGSCSTSSTSYPSWR